MKSLVAVWLALVVAILAAPLYAQPRQPTLEVQTATGQTTFHIGERIPLMLRFTSPNATQYSIYDCCFGRDAPTGFESFNITPSTGWADPLATFYAYAGYPPMTAEIGSVPFVASKPVEGSFDLNQWVRFDRPGVYTVRVKSGRVQDAVYSGHQRRPLQSNPIELHIIPATPEWQSATLDRGDEADLIYLATPAAIEKMTEQLREPRYGPQCRVGLLGLPESMHDLAVASMKKRLDEPDYPITAMFFDTMVVLGLNTVSDLEGFLKQELQTSPGPEVERFRNQERTVRANLLQAVLDAARNKEPAARAETVQMLLLTQQNVEAPAAKMTDPVGRINIGIVPATCSYSKKACPAP